jgi:uncharacterized membrane protein
MADDERERDDDSQDDGIYETLRDRIGGAGKEVLVPVAASAAAAAATWVAKKGPDLLKELSSGSTNGGAKGLAAGAAAKALKRDGEGGALKGLAGKAMEKVAPGSSGGSGWGKGRRLPILRSIDVAAPVEEVYEQWTNFDEFRTFMHRVEGVEQEDDDTVVWNENIWSRRRRWEADITEQVRNQKIAWEIKSGGQGSGVITFHKLAPRLTRIEVVFDWQPQGIVEKLASGLRFHKRAAKADLYRFKAFVETGGEERGGTAEDDGDGDEDSTPRRRSSGDDRDAAREQRERARQERRAGGSRTSP